MITTSERPNWLVSVSRTIASIDLAVSVRHAASTFAEHMGGLLIDALLDLAQVTLLNTEPNLFRIRISHWLLSRHSPETRTPFETLLFYDARLWKRARMKLRELYVNLLTLGPVTKREIGSQFAYVYADLVETFLLNDREPDISVLFLSVQLFSVPSVATHLLNTRPNGRAAPNFLAHLLDIMTSFFTEQRIPDHNGRRLLLPPSPARLSIDPESSAFKHKRYFHLFHDFVHLISSPESQRIICGDTSHLHRFQRFINIFSNMTPMRRAIELHIEFESESWISAFNLTIQLAKACRAFGSAYAQASPQQLFDALLLLSNYSIPSGPDAQSVTTHTVTWMGTTFELLHYDIKTESVSWHHPIQWLWTEISRQIKTVCKAQIPELTVANLRSLLKLDTPSGYQAFLCTMEQPIRGKFSWSVCKGPSGLMLDDSVCTFSPYSSRSLGP